MTQCLIGQSSITLTQPFPLTAESSRVNFSVGTVEMVEKREINAIHYQLMLASLTGLWYIRLRLGSTSQHT